MDDLNRWQRWWVNAWPHRWHVRRHIPSFLKNSPDPFRGEVLEVGAGQGWTSRQILDTFPQVELTATDIEGGKKDTYDQLRQKYGRRLKVKTANILKLPFDRDAFDIVIAVSVMSYLPPSAAQDALRELLRVTRPGGLIGISDFVLFARSRHTGRAHIENALRGEKAQIVYAKGDQMFDMWIRVDYPIPPPGAATE